LRENRAAAERPNNPPAPVIKTVFAPESDLVLASMSLIGLGRNCKVKDTEGIPK